MFNKLSRLIIITGETKDIAKEVVPLMVRAPVVSMPLNEINNLRHFANRLLRLTDGIIFSDEASLNEVVQNNFEFLDTMRTVLFHLLNLSEKQNFPISDKNYLRFLLAKIDNLIAQLNSPPFLQPRKSAIRRKFTEDKSDEDFTECDFI